MATADQRGRTARLGPWLAVAVAVVAALAATRAAADPAAGPVPAPPPEPVTVAATSAVTYGSVATLRDAATVVVRGRITAAARGPVVGAPAADAGSAAGIVSRRLTVDVLEVLGGPPPALPLTIDEEGWLLDGRPIAVNGVAPVAVGGEAVWFLAPLPPESGAGWVQVNSQGRFEVLAGGALRGADPADPLVHRVEADGLDVLVAGVRHP